MQKLYNLFVPSEYTFQTHFLPKIKDPSLDPFEVDASRQGVQRKGNNHLVVFLDFCLKARAADFIEAAKGENYHFKTPADIETFRKVFAPRQEVALYSLSYHPRMTVLAWKLLIDIAHDDRTLVEDDEENLMMGPVCAQELKQMLSQL